MLANGHTIIQLLDKLAHKRLAMENDKIGLQLGTLNKPIQKVMIALDVTNEVVDEAIDAGVDLIIAHHAIIFRPLAKIDTATPAGKLYEKLIKNDIAVFIAHTNLDSADGGINDWLADSIGIASEGRDLLEEVYTEKLYKLVVYVPASHTEQVLQAMWSAGAGHIGAYSHCSFAADGQGTFLPGQDTSPYSGKQGVLSYAAEQRVETIVPASLQRKVLQAMLKAHPYEEAAYDWLALENEGKRYGLGRVGKLEQPQTLGSYANHIKQQLGLPQVRVVGALDKPLKKAAVLGGSGARYVRYAQFAGADVLVTGDIDYHTAHDALADGMCIIDAGHNIEKIMKHKLAEWLTAELTGTKYETKVIFSSVDTEAFTFV